MLQDLYTAAGENVGTSPWQAYPRPQMKRGSFYNLNGFWDFTASDTNDLPELYEHTILVPFCPESLLSGIHRHFSDSSILFYRKKFTLPEGFQQGRILLHFGAVDQIAEVLVNGRFLCRHEGGYESFYADITDALLPENELIVRVWDNLKDQSFPYGKQTLKRGGMWYTPVSGIWQTVWLESVPEVHISSLDIQVNTQTAQITVTPALSGQIFCDGKEYPLADGKAEIRPENPRLWSPEDPYLYEFTVLTEQDRVDSYFALRSLEIKTVDSFPRLCLNGKPYFFHGLLDQGYWSDGLFTPATPEGFREDILAMKGLGFNTLRKHIKVEPEQFYYDCDRLGMVVFQDMVNNSDYRFLRDTAIPGGLGLQKLYDRKRHRRSDHRKRFCEGMTATVNQLKNHPCICCWTIFNEGWGQFDSDNMYHRLRELDSSRFIDTTSGWFRRTQTDVESLHIYFGSWHQLKPSDKPLVLSEFGGYCYGVAEHIFNPGKSYGYKACKTQENFNRDLLALYRNRIIPAVKNGLCAAIYTQVSDVEDEINGLLTYDRKVCKADKENMLAIAKELTASILNK